MRTNHPHKFTLDLLERVINLAPQWFPKQEHDKLKDELQRFENDPNATKEDIEKAITDVGRVIWPYRRALFDLHEKYGKKIEEQHLKERVDDELKNKLEKFFTDGGTPDDLGRGDLSFETSFLPEEKLQLASIIIAVHEELMLQFQNECVTSRRMECQNLVEYYHEEQVEIEHLIQHLKNMAVDSQTWSGEILEKVKAFEDGWSLVDREVTKEEVQKTIEFYKDILEAGVL